MRACVCRKALFDTHTLSYIVQHLTFHSSCIKLTSHERKQELNHDYPIRHRQPGVYIKTLRKAYESFTTNNKIDELIAATKSIGTAIESPDDSNASNPESKSPFDYVWQ